MKGTEEIVKLLDECLEYVKHEVWGDRITNWVKSAKKELICPYCEKLSKKVHSRYEKSFQDLPIQGKKTTIVVIRRKMFCESKECKKKTFAEPLDFVEPKFKRTTRLEKEILNINLSMSSVQAAKL
ncbi:transposase [Petrotoga sp. HWH.PT.55.6.1]|uniref:transposase family protein n=1 Tax=unclassified Petrotoga TaxID=2620614 RepID=UPI000CA0419F|nr:MULTISPECIES: transposase family protein [unclassified Petrotoga]PNR91282.1 transposase IS204 [Petrotoga sp. HWHPT.55.6.3]RPD35470.1 transposase [Petrotoga sp. HWH.PT.55.6.1]